MIQYIWGNVFAAIGWGVIWMPAAHFVLSGFVGSLVYWWISTILRRGFSTTGSGRTCLTESSIQRYSWALALSFSVAAHVLEDFFIKAF